MFTIEDQTNAIYAMMVFAAIALCAVIFLTVTNVQLKLENRKLRKDNRRLQYQVLDLTSEAELAKLKDYSTKDVALTSRSFDAIDATREEIEQLQREWRENNSQLVSFWQEPTPKLERISGQLVGDDTLAMLAQNND